jgi:hypothetical protein
MVPDRAKQRLRALIERSLSRIAQCGQHSASGTTLTHHLIANSTNAISVYSLQARPLCRTPPLQILTSGPCGDRNIRRRQTAAPKQRQ